MPALCHGIVLQLRKVRHREVKCLPSSLSDRARTWGKVWVHCPPLGPGGGLDSTSKVPSLLWMGLTSLGLAESWAQGSGDAASVVGEAGAHQVPEAYAEPHPAQRQRV